MMRTDVPAKSRPSAENRTAPDGNGHVGWIAKMRILITVLQNYKPLQINFVKNFTLDISCTNQMIDRK